jgi:hypothetical protein
VATAADGEPAELGGLVFAFCICVT